MSVPVTPNMGLPLPVPGVTPGPLWASLLNQADTTIDSHDHSFGSGVQVPSSGLNINAGLAFNGWPLTNVLSVGFGSTAPGSPTTGTLFANGGNLFFQSGSGLVQVTPIGSAAGGWTGLASPASATYGTGIFSLFKNTSTYGQINAGTVQIFQENGSGANGVAISASSSQASNYAWTLPVAQAAVNGSLLTASSTGVMSWSTLDGTTLISTSGTLSVGSITHLNIAANSVAGSQIQALTITAANMADGAATNLVVGGATPQIQGTIQTSGASTPVITFTGARFNTLTPTLTIVTSSKGHNAIQITWTPATPDAGITTADIMVTLQGLEAATLPVLPYIDGVIPGPTPGVVIGAYQPNSTFVNCGDMLFNFQISY